MKWQKSSCFSYISFFCFSNFDIPALDKQTASWCGESTGRKKSQITSVLLRNLSSTDTSVSFVVYIFYTKNIDFSVDNQGKETAKKF